MLTSQIIVDTPRESRQRARNALFFGLIALSLVVFWRPILDVIQLAWRSDEYTHAFLILPVSFALIYLQRNLLKRPAKFEPIAGSALAAGSFALIIGLKAHLYYVSDDAALSVSIFSLVLFWMAAFIGCYGSNIFKSLAFPFLLLFLLVPPTGLMLERATTFLQSASTEATYALFNLFGLPVLKNGFLLSFPTLQIEVAKECSGIRSSIMLLLTGLILAHLFLRPLWSKIVFVLCIVPLSVAKNAIRIFSLSMLGMHVDPGFLTGPLHHQGGIVFFLIALGGLMLLLWILQRLGTPRVTVDRRATAI